MNKDAFRLISPSGTETELPVRSGTTGPDVIDVGKLYKEQGVFTYDPGFVSTGSCESDITYIDGEKGILMYRGYPVEQLAEHSNFLAVSYLLLHGELPNKDELEQFDRTVRTHTMLNETMLRLFDGFHHDAHPMAMVTGVMASMSAFYHSTTNISDPHDRDVFVPLPPPAPVARVFLGLNIVCHPYFGSTSSSFPRGCAKE